MRSPKPHVLFITYNGLLEPLGQRQGLAYLEALTDEYRFTVLSFEKARGIELDSGRAQMSARLGPAGIRWRVLPYHKRPSLPATAYDVWAGARAARTIVREDGVDLVHARSYVPAAIAHRATRGSSTPYIFDVRGLLAEEYVDGGIWRTGSLPYRLTKRAEQTLLHDASGIVTLTEAVVPQLESNPGLVSRDAVPWAVIPCCVRVDEFEVDAGVRSRVRDELRLGERPMLVYSGSVGTWYLLDEMIAYYRAARDVVPSLALLLLLNRDHDLAHGALARAGIDDADVRVTGVSPEDVPAHLAAADAGIGFIRPAPSKVASSPTKLAEYLASGIPAVVNAGVGDTHTLATEPSVHVVEDLSPTGLLEAAALLPGVLDTDRAAARALARRCFSISEVGGRRYGRLYQDVLGRSGSEERR